MVAGSPRWVVQGRADPFSADWAKALRQECSQLPGSLTAALGQTALQILWQRGQRDLKLIPGFLDPRFYVPTSPQAFGEEMAQAVQRLLAASDRQEKVAIWGDFDADGVTATAVLWDGLGQFFQKDHQLRYYIPNRFTESHGISRAGLESLADWGCGLVVTADTGSTSLAELEYASQLGMAVIVTDHHTMPAVRPPVTAIINPRSLPSGHPLGTLSGVAVAYKLVEALYQAKPEIPEESLENLLDLVAIGLIADLVELTGDCRYLTQLGLQRLQQHLPAGDQARRPGIAHLLELCKRTGDRPSDVAFGIGPRINAVSRIHGDARFCVDLLTSRDVAHCRTLALEAELANSRRKALQRDLMQQVAAKIAEIDLATTAVIVLADEQWPAGVLGLVAGQVVQEYGRPTILLRLDPVGPDQPAQPRLARGSARSLPGLDLYQLFQTQAHLLSSYGGHPLAAGLALPVEHVAVLRTALNRQVRQQLRLVEGNVGPTLTVDLEVTVAELGQGLFRQLKLLEPYGMGNPIPRLLIRNAWFENAWHRKIRDQRGGKLAYLRTEFELWDDTVQLGFPGEWWDHYRDDLPEGRCDLVVELDFNTRQRYRSRASDDRYQARLIAVRPSQTHPTTTVSRIPLLDWRQSLPPLDLPDQSPDLPANLQVIDHYPRHWGDWQAQWRQAEAAQQPLAIAYPAPPDQPATTLWRELVGIAKYLSRTQQSTEAEIVAQRLGIDPTTLKIGLEALVACGFEVMSDADGGLHIAYRPEPLAPSRDAAAAIADFLEAIQEEHFRQRYFYQVPLATLQTMAQVDGAG